MTAETLLAVQIVAALLAILCGVLGWLAKTWTVKDQLAAKHEALEAREAQVESLNAQLQDTRALRPMHIREHLLQLKRQLDEQTSSVEDGIIAAERRRGEILEQMEEQRSQVSIARLRVAELDDRKRSLQDFTLELRELIAKSGSGSRHFESGNNAIKAAEAEHTGVLAQIGAEQERIAAAAATIANLDRELQDCEHKAARLRDTLQAVAARQEHLRVGIDAVLSTLLDRGELSAPRVRSIAAASGTAQDLDRIDVPRIKTYDA